MKFNNEMSFNNEYCKDNKSEYVKPSVEIYTLCDDLLAMERVSLEGEVEDYGDGDDF